MKWGKPAGRCSRILSIWLLSKIRLLEGRAAQMKILLHYYAYGKPRETVEQAGGAANRDLLAGR
jgi:hypothetical protein